MQGGKYTLYSLKTSVNCTAYLGELEERNEKIKIQSRDIANHREQIFKGSEML